MNTLPFALPMPEDTGLVFDHLQRLAAPHAWERSGDGTVAMAIAGPYHLTSVRQWGHVTITVTVEQWVLQVKLPGATLEQGCEMLLRSLRNLLSWAGPAEAEAAPAPVRLRSIEAPVVDPPARKNYSWAIPWEDMAPGEEHVVNLPEDLTLLIAFRKVSALGQYRNEPGKHTGGPQWKVEMRVDELVVTRNR